MEGVVSSFWKNKKVFLTGHTGFKGSWMSLWLLKMGAQVTGYSLAPNTNPALYDLVGLSKEMKSYEGDIGNYQKLENAVRESNPDIVIHMAAQALVRASYVNPIETYQTNVMGTVHILESVRKAGANVQALVNVTTDKCYENLESTWAYKENDRLGGYDPYSSSKACSELVTSAFRQSYFNPKDFEKHGVGIATARAGNVIGGGDWSEDRLLPDIFRALSQNNQIVIRNPKSTRPWQHVLEPLSGYFLLLQKIFEDKQKYSEAFNFGPDLGDTQNVETIVKQIIKLWGPEAKYTITAATGPYEAQLLTLDCSNARNKLGWKPRWALSETLPGIVDWYRKVYDEPTQARSITLEQIEQYEKSV